MHAMSELAVNVLAASRREGDREVARTIADRLYYNAVQAARENGEPFFRRRRRGCCASGAGGGTRSSSAAAASTKARSDSSSPCWAFGLALLSDDVVRAVAGPDAEDDGTWCMVAGTKVLVLKKTHLTFMRTAAC